MRYPSRHLTSVVAAVLAAAACHDTTEPDLPSPLAVMVSNPVLRAGTSAASVSLSTTGAAIDSVAFVSIAPGSAPDATRATIENRRTGQVIATAMAGGGFDPVGVPAAAGDTLDVRMTLATGGLASARAIVPARRPPRVVRTSPTRARTDVALNAIVVVIFSEPIDRATVDDRSIKLLRRGGAAVAGEIRYTAGSGVSVEFVPSAPLAPATDYELLLSGLIKDLSGDALEVIGSTGFTTVAAAQPPVTPSDPIPPVPGSDPIAPSGSHLAFTTQPSDVVAFTPFAPAVVVTLRNAQGATLTRFTGTVTLRLDPDAGDVFLWGMYVDAVAGVATFPVVALPAAGSGYTLVATAEPATSARSDDFTVLETPWMGMAAPPNWRYYAAGAVLRGMLYHIGGTTDPEDHIGATGSVDAYDPEMGIWFSRAPVPSPRQRAGAGVVDDILYVVGGDSGDGPLSTVQAYDPTTDTWADRAPMHVARNNPGVGVVDGILYVIGGTDVGGSVEAYDPRTDSWTLKTDMPTPRAGAGIGVVDGILYAVGGGNGFTGEAAVEAYDPVTDSWTTRSPLPFARGFSGIAVIEDRLYVLGGFTGSPPQYVNSLNPQYVANVDVYDPTTNSWSPRPSLPARGVTIAGVIDGTVYAIVEGFLTFAYEP